jgi:inorganic pyrophosphatase
MKLPSTFQENKKTINVVIETPRGSRNKYVYDIKNDYFELRKVLPFGTVFPFDFGLIPGTLGEDGQPLDVVVLMDFASFPGCVIECRCLGVIMAEQTEKRKKFRNDRLLTVPVKSRSYEKAKSIKDLNHGIIDEYVHFFEYYNEMEGKKFKLLRLSDAKAAIKLIEKHVL